MRVWIPRVVIKAEVNQVELIYHYDLNLNELKKIRGAWNKALCHFGECHLQEGDVILSTMSSQVFAAEECDVYLVMVMSKKKLTASLRWKDDQRAKTFDGCLMQLWHGNAKFEGGLPAIILSKIEQLLGFKCSKIIKSEGVMLNELAIPERGVVSLDSIRRLLQREGI